MITDIPVPDQPARMTGASLHAWRPAAEPAEIGRWLAGACLGSDVRAVTSDWSGDDAIVSSVTLWNHPSGVDPVPVAGRLAVMPGVMSCTLHAVPGRAARIIVRRRTR